MKKILIVDDEPFIAKSIQLMIEATGTDFCVCGIANNGRQAETMFYEQKPDVILTDIRMPIMDGLELIRRLSPRTPSPLFIILSGYGEFEYAREALKMGVFDYLLKPIEPKALTEVLTRAHQELNKTYSNISTRLLRDLLNGPGTGSISLEITKYLGLDRYAFMILNAGSYFHFSYSPSSSYTDFWETENLNRFLPDVHSDNGWIIGGIRPNEKILIYEISGDDTPLHRFRELYRTISRQPVPINCTYGIHSGGILTLNETISKYRLVLSRNIAYGYPNCIDPDSSLTVSNNRLLLSDSDKSELSLLFRTGKEKGLIQAITNKIKQYKTLKIRQIDLQFYLLEMLYLLDSVLAPDDRDQEDLLYFVTDIINDTWDYERLTERYLRLISELMQRTEKAAACTPQELAAKVKEYIGNHYTENLNLQKLADTFGFVPPYLSRVFKKELGMSPSEYILQLKVERIKYLLKLDSRLSLKEIAENTGFNDSFYMSKVFKLSTGVTPSEYRSVHTENS